VVCVLLSCSKCRTSQTKIRENGCFLIRVSGENLLFVCLSVFLVTNLEFAAGAILPNADKFGMCPGDKFGLSSQLTYCLFRTGMSH
jgi:hypothetical protein